jgi:hypothetical protein
MYSIKCYNHSDVHPEDPVRAKVPEQVRCIPDRSVQSALKTLLDGKGISLGSQLYKIRMRDEHKGKSGSFRTLWFWKRGELVILCFPFAKKPGGKPDRQGRKGFEAVGEIMEWFDPG